MTGATIAAERQKVCDQIAVQHHTADEAHAEMGYLERALSAAAAAGQPVQEYRDALDAAYRAARNAQLAAEVLEVRVRVLDIERGRLRSEEQAAEMTALSEDMHATAKALDDQIASLRAIVESFLVAADILHRASAAPTPHPPADVVAQALTAREGPRG
jgi:hypothetical protein